MSLMAHPGRPRTWRSVVLLGAGYFMVGVLWIWLSDEWVNAISDDPGWRAAAQHYKGIVYITVTALGLMGVVQRGYKRLLTMQARLDEQRHERDVALAALHSGLEQLVAERTSELEQANIELEAFSRTAAHDLKSPLNGIVGMSRLLREKLGPRLEPPESRCVDQIERSAMDMAHLVDDLLMLSSAGSTELRRREADLAPMARQIVDDLRLQEPARQVRVSLPESLVAYCDEGLMRSVLQNLIGNAWKFTSTREQAHIELSASRTADETVLRVSDNGAGFDASGMPGLLRPFQRFHTQAQFPGNGLGLVTCQRIAQRHGGRLQLESVPGEGTRVSVALPHRHDDGAPRGPVPASGGGRGQLPQPMAAMRS